MQPKKEFLQGFEECFRSVKDSRQANKIDYPLIEILFLRELRKNMRKCVIRLYRIITYRTFSQLSC